MPTNCDNVTTLPISPHSHPGPTTLACVGAGLTATEVSVGAVLTANDVSEGFPRGCVPMPATNFTSANPQRIHARTKTARPATLRTNPVPLP